MNDTVSKFINGMESSDYKKDYKEMKQTSKAAAMNVGHSLEDISNRMVETTTDLSERAMSTIKKYPLHTALAVGAVGFIVGAIVARK